MITTDLTKLDKETIAKYRGREGQYLAELRRVRTMLRRARWPHAYQEKLTT